MFDFKDKTVLIIGAAGDIGTAVTKELAGGGAKELIISDINYEKVKKVAITVEAEHMCRCTVVKTDLSVSDDIKALFNVVKSKSNTLDIFINCAGVCPVATFEEIDENEWDRVMAINLKGAYLCTREALFLMKPKKYGKIINVSSISGRIGAIATGINYASSKGAIIAMTKTLAKVVGPFNININAIAPGFIDTEMTKGFKHFDPMTVPLRRIGTPNDVASVVAFLASDCSSYITGCTIDINGGVYMT